MRHFVLAILSLLVAACGGPALHSQESYVFGTRVEVLVWGAPEDVARAATAEVLREFDRLHRVYHAWQPSEMTALNEALATGRPHDVTPEFANFIREAQEVAARGEYLFDPGIGRLVELWGFHDDTFKPQLPDQAKLAELIASRPSIAKLQVERAKVSLRGTPGSAVALDFGGYLKGVALDRAVVILKRRGIANALINIGGNVMAMGSKGDTPWRVGIQHPRAATPLATLELKDGEAIGTSGDYQRYFELEDKRYCHLIDPRTGWPSEGTQAVTVLIPPRPKAGMWSDVASKPIFIAGKDWRRLADKLGMKQVLRVDADGRVETTDAMRARVKLESSK
ncbi:MAG: FAD:protein FMN transferase [Gammaproteobacteria bacterium]|nr:FAD:protein FMN transferase [Gammaproteobacteria bacterium]MBU1415928.1 FAD:protein FMN transferase [Gammaproteobacteria bacterium]